MNNWQKYTNPGHPVMLDDQDRVVRKPNGDIVFMSEHIYESILGRPLEENEVVIHKNGNILDLEDTNLTHRQLSAQEIEQNYPLAVAVWGSRLKRSKRHNNPPREFSWGVAQDPELEPNQN